jgi:hypothetical protein
VSGVDLVIIVGIVVFCALVLLGAAGRWIDAGADRREGTGKQS